MRDSGDSHDAAILASTRLTHLPTGPLLLNLGRTSLDHLTKDNSKVPDPLGADERTAGKLTVWAGLLSAAWSARSPMTPSLKTRASRAKTR
jgi:hypothetical protein